MHLIFSSLLFLVYTNKNFNFYIFFSTFNVMFSFGFSMIFGLHLILAEQSNYTVLKNSSLDWSLALLDYMVREWSRVVETTLNKTKSRPEPLGTETKSRQIPLQGETKSRPQPVNDPL